MPNKITYEKRKEVYELAIVEYGHVRQIIKAVEEMSELTKELCKPFADNSAYNAVNIAEEIGDVTIMMEQLRLIFDINDEVCEMMDNKVRRLENRLK